MPHRPEHLGAGHTATISLQSEFGSRRKARLEPDARCAPREEVCTQRGEGTESALRNRN
jgi:hypothetical protein